MNRTPFPTDITHQDIAPTFIDGANITGVDAIDIESLLDVIEKKSSVIEEQKQRIEVLEEYLRLERARRFGPSSEKNSAQAEILFDEAEALEDISAATTALEALQEQTGTPKKLSLINI